MKCLRMGVDLWSGSCYQHMRMPIAACHDKYSSFLAFLKSLTGLQDAESGDFTSHTPVPEG